VAWCNCITSFNNCFRTQKITENFLYQIFKLMIQNPKTNITVQITLNAKQNLVWEMFTNPKHIINWNAASDDWHCPKAENELFVGGRSNIRMEAKDGSVGFDFKWTFTKIQAPKILEYTLEDNRKVWIEFIEINGQTTLIEKFETEMENSVELQKAGWQSILNNFKKYVESEIKIEKLTFEVSIAASVEKVYSTMLNESYYRQWTYAFNPTSFFRGSWEKNSKILFVGTDKNGNESGMISRIAENIPNEFVSIEHLGYLQNGVEILSGAEVEKWQGSHENYFYKSQKEGTLLKIEVDANKDLKSYLLEKYPMALKLLKDVCEK
jgi:uncharacterized protein YndB with AHSA1/START domain